MPKRKKIYAILYKANVGVVSDIEVDKEDEKEAMKEFQRLLGVDNTAGCSIRFSNKTPFYYGKGGKVWIKGAITNKGALRTEAKKEGLIKGDEKLSKTDLNKLGKKGGKTKKRVVLAETLRKFEDGGNDWVGFKADIKGKDIDIYGAKPNADIEITPSSFIVEFDLDPEMRMDRIKSIGVIIKKVIGDIEIENIEEDEKNNKVSIINIDTSLNSEWVIKNEMKFKDDGALQVDSIEIDLTKKTITIN